MVDGPKLGLLGTLARSKRRRIVASLVFSIAVGLAISSVVPLLFALWMCGSLYCSHGSWVWAVLLGALLSHFIMLPIAILASAYAFYSCDMKLSVLADFTGTTASGRPISPPDLRPRTPMRKVFRAAGVGWLILLAIWIGSTAEFAYRMNNVCEPGDHIILSDSDAIKQAQMRLFRARYGSHGRPYVDEKPGYADFSQANCCEVKKTRTAAGVIVWEVGLEGETIGEPKKRHVSALIRLSNCGVVFVEDSYVFADPIR